VVPINERKFKRENRNETMQYVLDMLSLREM
jgi:hypothetical protein